MLERLLPFLDIVVVEQELDGSFHGIVPFPQWFLDFFPDARAPETALDFESKSPFLSDFISRAAELWKTGEEGSMGSGAWTETDSTGTERTLHATAVSLSGRRILLIEPAKVPVQEAQVLLQKGRQKSLDFRTVKRKQRSLRKVQQRYLALLDAVPDWVFIVHQDGSLVEYSKGRETLFESSDPETGKQISDFLPQDLSAQLSSLIENVISSGRPQMWKYRQESRSIEVLILATGQDEAMCILRRKSP
jgi:PAS domain-containing protein